MEKLDFNGYAIRLSGGSHERPQDGMCVMECVAYIAGERHTDRPACADVAATALAITLNDAAACDEQRQRLVPFVLRLANSRGKLSLQDHERAVEADILLNTARSVFPPWSEKRQAMWEEAFKTLDSVLPPLQEEVQHAQAEMQRLHDKQKELGLVTA